MPEKKARFSIVEETWVDDEIQALDTREVPTIVVSREAGSGIPWAFLAGLLAICLTILVVQGVHRSSGIGSEVQVDTEAGDSLKEAETWLKSADESLQNKDYELAAVQFEKALGILHKGEAERTRLIKIRVDLALAFQMDGQLEAAHKEWSSLVGIEPRAREKIVALEKELRIKANGLLSESAAAREARDYKSALATADRAQELYKSYGGSQNQLAQSLESSARTSLADGNLVAAESNLQLAQKFAWSQERADLLTRIAPKAQVRAGGSRPPVSRRPSLGEPSSIPQAERPLEPEFPVGGQDSPAVSVPVAVPVYRPTATSAPAAEPVPYQPPPTSPAADTGRAQSQSQEHLGKEGVLDSYQSSRARTGNVRGY